MRRALSAVCRAGWLWVLLSAPPASALEPASPSPKTTAPPAAPASRAPAVAASSPPRGAAPGSPGASAALGSPGAGAALGSPGAGAAPSDGAADMQAYHRALAARRLDALAPLTPEALRVRLFEVQELAAQGRHDEVIATLLATVESPRFADFVDGEQGHATVYALGDAFATVGAHQPARAYLKRLLGLPPADTYARRAARRLTDIALETGMFAPISLDFDAIPSAERPEETRGELAYVKGRARELDGDADAALASYAKISQKSRFWAQAVYLSGLIEAERGHYKQAENLFCQVADPKRAERTAPFFADERFFAVRDLARLGLGRVAHEQLRFDDARYYYYLVPQDSDHLAESLYESATSRYEKKDYEGARELLDELKRLSVHHPYEDEAWILGAYTDLARCRFEEADRELKGFIARYEPVRNVARDLSADETSLAGQIVAAESSPNKPSADKAPLDPIVTIAWAVRQDPRYLTLTHRIEQLDAQASGLRASLGQVAGLVHAISTAEGVRPAAAPLDEPASDLADRAVREALGLRRQLTQLERAGAPAASLAPLRRELSLLEARLAGESGARARRSAEDAVPAAAPLSAGQDLAPLLGRDRALAATLAVSAQAARVNLLRAREAVIADGVRRYQNRLSRLLRRARLGRIESVLGRKRGLEVEVEALAAGVLPRSALDSLAVTRYLRDSEEYWPFEGDDWPDEYVGGEGLR